MKEIAVPKSTDVERFKGSIPIPAIPDDSFIVVEAMGDRSMWPVFTPHEFASIQISDAVGVIGGAFGFGNKYGKYRPSPINDVRPYAFTNPIWVSHSSKLRSLPPKKVLPVINSEPFSPRVIKDVRTLFLNFHADPSD